MVRLDVRTTRLTIPFDVSGPVHVYHQLSANHGKPLKPFLLSPSVVAYSIQRLYRNPGASAPSRLGAQTIAGVHGTAAKRKVSTLRRSIGPGQRFRMSLARNWRVETRTHPSGGNTPKRSTFRFTTRNDAPNRAQAENPSRLPTRLPAKIGAAGDVSGDGNLHGLDLRLR